MKRRRRHLLVGLAVGALVASTGLVGIHYAGAEVPTPVAVGGEMPNALGAHLERLRRAVPGDSGMSPDGPGGAAQQAFLERAYPADAITIAQLDRSKAAFTAADKRFRGSRQWTNVGPSEALYPFTEYRNAFNYVPNEYVAGGRVTSIDISPDCSKLLCRAYVTPAGGGVWGTLNILAAEPKWFYLGGPLGINAAGAVTIDRNDRTGLTIYVGTGEANTCGSGCVAGVGLYRSTNGGLTWSGPLGKDALGGKGIGEITIKPGDPKTLYVATTTALRGMSSSCCTGVTRPVPDAEKWGLYKSTNGGKSWKFIHNGSADATACTGSAAEYNNTATCSPRGVRQVKLDPRDADIVYASSYGRGVWRSSDAGATWTQIKPSLNPAMFQTRPAIDVTALPGGKTRMYVYEGNTGTPYSRLFRSDDVAAGTPTFTDLTSSNPADPGFATYNQCTGQCWYDVFVHTPAGHPDIVYTGGSYLYGETVANKRAVIMSTDAGVSGTDMTYDGTDELHPNGLHPDQHDLVTNPRNPYQFFEANDGGVMRSSGEFVDRSSWCDNPDRNLTTQAQRDRCRQMLSKIPSKLDGVNKGMNTLQFISLSASPHDVNLLQGGTQDNGTWENKGQRQRWVNTMIGDGGASGWDVARPEFRFHTYYDVSPEVSFANGDIASWIWTADPIYGQPGSLFYAPVISDPKVSGTMFAGTGRTAYRTKTFGLGDRTLAEADRICNSWTGTYEEDCGDWEPLGTTNLTDAGWGDRAGGAVSVIQRVDSDSSTAWAATSTGRVFVSRNVDAEPAAAVTWTRVDSATSPNRFVTSIHIDPANPDRAWISYSGYGSNTPTTPGHAFEVTATADGATWSDRSYDFGDQPITDLVRDDVTGDLYASTDFGVLLLPKGKKSWTKAARGMPNVEVAGLTIVPGERILYAASHGLGAWKMTLR
ncbi:sialidase family protein [Verrucosispora sp. WMMA2121]|uniref:WD40/YVTN/BNR-like repeat-containing protein n=1 Tax=Verrucosispora sp. WMMA2121 TaxID=3015164 RepID=UPI0022B7279B|nr:sialidase family protein [Verrucosispora sp. WMMA2121]MCZ7423025.1 sialidase family protein [Verrucosispora sp. WMMA2121]